jgi:hypothetical protein
MRSSPALPTHRPIDAAIIDYHQHRSELPDRIRPHRIINGFGLKLNTPLAI